MNNELKDILKASDRYQGFTFFDKPVCFKDIFKDKNFDAVQLHSTQIIDIGNGIKNIVGFCGAFKWHNNEITSLDGDDYSNSFNVLGFKEFDYEENGMQLKGINTLNTIGVELKIGNKIMNNKCMQNNESEDIVKIRVSSDNEQKITLLEKPVCFQNIFKDKNFDTVHLYLAHIIDERMIHIVRYCGAFKWYNNEIILFDGDHCNDNFKVLGFEEFDYEEYGNGIQLKGLKGIDIFVENN